MDLSDPFNAQLFKTVVSACGAAAFFGIVIIGSVVVRPKTFKDLWRMFLYAAIGSIVTTVMVIVVISYINAHYF